jgi:adenylylsulfate kinase
MSAINPYESVRKEIGGNLVYIKCNLDTTIDRDTKGLYAMALSGKIKNFTGVSDPFEEPINPALLLETDKESINDSVNSLYNFILKNI